MVKTGRKGSGKKESVKRKSDSKARVVLFADFADSLLVVERVSETEVRVIKQKARAGRIPLETLLAGITQENLHGEVQTGPAVGNEAW